MILAEVLSFSLCKWNFYFENIVMLVFSPFSLCLCKNRLLGSWTRTFNVYRLSLLPKDAIGTGILFHSNSFPMISNDEIHNLTAHPQFIISDGRVSSNIVFPKLKKFTLVQNYSVFLIYDCLIMLST
jgi:hypothetical protein